ncbi:DNA polymerase [Acidithiobacillus thiooxidans]|uniref:DNA polymerase n=1 Tax=Acidithiobacillus thiooxidans TaxID=930 RepID=UPI000466D871|nr:DNA polymerase [Acidithiobacillus thiooxidans]
MGEIKSAVDFLDQFFGGAVVQPASVEAAITSTQDDQPPVPGSKEGEGDANIFASACLRVGATQIRSLAPHHVEVMTPSTTELLPASNAPVLSMPSEEQSEFIEITEDDVVFADRPHTANPHPFSLDMDDFAIPEPQQVAASCADAPTDFLTSLDPLAFEAISRAEELSIDVETSVKGTPWSPAEAPGKAAKLGTDQTIGQYLKAHGATLDARPRMRILSIGAGGWKGAFDLDKMGESKKMELLGLLDGKVWTGHNLAFDLLWIKHTATEVNPKMLIDTMFLATAIRPDIERMIHERIVATTIGGQQPVRLAGKNAGTVEQELQKILIERSASKNGKDDDAKSAYPLATLSLVFLNEKMDKSFQNSTNWMPSVLTADHLNYCIGDITAPAIIARRMLNLPDDAPIAELIAALDIKKVPGAWAYTRAFEPAARRLTYCTLKGIPLSQTNINKYRNVLQNDADIALEKVLSLAPGLEPFRDRLASPSGGLTAELKEAIADALKMRTGTEVERKDTGQPKLGAKDLLERFPDEPLITARRDLDGALKRKSMIDDYAVFAGQDSRVHGTITVGTVTGRTRSGNPNMQNAPRNPEFRACFAATTGHQILAIDYSAMELRIAAALGARAYGQFLKLMEAPRLSKVKWILKLPNMLDYIEGKKPLPVGWPIQKPDYLSEQKPSIQDYGLVFGSELACICRDLRNGGAAFSNAQTDLLRFREVFRAGLDPHILTAVAMEAMAGRFDTGGLAPLEYMKSLSADQAKALKKALAGPRQAAKALGFGLLYGMSAGGLYHYGITSYGLSWTMEEAVEARAAWFRLYPEIALWHWMTAHAGGKLKSDVFDVRKNECRGDGEGGKFYQGRTLSGRVVEGLELREALNYSDQGTGGEIALHAITNLPDDIAGMLVGFVHDELIFEVPEGRAEDVSVEVTRVMNESAETLLKLFDVPSEVEAALGQHWIH